MVYGTNQTGTVKEKPYHLTHKTAFSKHFNEGYPLAIIGKNLEEAKREIEDLREKCSRKDARWHLHEIGIEKGGYTVEQYRELFSWALEMDNVLVCPTLKNGR